MMSGVRASSMSTESTSSTIAYTCGALHALLERRHHVVAQVVEAELVVRAVRDVGEVRGAALRRARLGVVEAADGEAEVAVQVPHPLRVAAGEVRVHRDEVRALARQRVQVQRQRRDERLAFARRHLGDLAEVELDAAHELDVVRHHVPLELAARDAHRRADQAARASRTVANASGRISSSVSAIAARSSPSTPPRPSAPLSSLSMPLALRRRRSPCASAPSARRRASRARAVRSRMMLAELLGLAAQLLLGDALQPRVVLVDLVDDRLDLFSSRSWRVPRTALITRFNMSPLSIQPVRRDVVRDGIRHETSNGFAFSHPPANLGGRNVDAPRRATRV